MLKISMFSKLSNLSTRVLHHYDEIDLLKPIYVDESNNYRYYKASQLKTANQISQLKYLGFSLTQIKTLITNDDLNIQKEYFEKRKYDVINELTSLNIQANLLGKASSILNMKEDYIMKYNVKQETITLDKVISTRGIIPTYQDEGMLWTKLEAYLKEYQVAFNNNTTSMAIYWDNEFKEKDVDVEILMSVTKEYPTTNDVIFKDGNSYQVASVTFNGSYDLMNEVLEAIAQWIEENSYQICGPMINIYYICHLQDPNPDNWVTKACCVIEKI